jgi:hypothetical protein
MNIASCFKVSSIHLQLRVESPVHRKEAILWSSASIVRGEGIDLQCQYAVSRGWRMERPASRVIILWVARILRSSDRQSRYSGPPDYLQHDLIRSPVTILWGSYLVALEGLQQCDQWLISIRMVSFYQFLLCLSTTYNRARADDGFHPTSTHNWFMYSTNPWYRGYPATQKYERYTQGVMQEACTCLGKATRLSYIYIPLTHWSLESSTASRHRDEQNWHCSLSCL